MSKKVLIVEDDAKFREFEKEILETNGYDVLEAGNAKDCVDTAIKESPDLIQMDIRLPNKKRGIGTARIIRDTEKTQNIPIIFVTAYTEGEQTNEVRNIPNCGYLTKPFEIPAFMSKIEHYLNMVKHENQ